MANPKRSLQDALQDSQPKIEFVSGKHSHQPNRSNYVVSPGKEGSQPTLLSPTLIPITTRLRTGTAEALKRAQLERKLAGLTMNSIQEIVEAAIVDWLRTNHSS